MFVFGQHRFLFKLVGNIVDLMIYKSFRDLQTLNTHSPVVALHYLTSDGRFGQGGNKLTDKQREQVDEERNE